MTALHLLADSETDAALISALVQDAILSSDDLRYDSAQRNVAVLMSRFRWEDAGKGAPSRVRSLLVIREVTRAARLCWPADTQPLELLAVRTGTGTIRLDFAEGPALRLAVDGVRMALEDVGDPWRVRHAPRHDRG